MRWKFGLIGVLLLIVSLGIVSAQQVNLALPSNGGTASGTGGPGELRGSIEFINNGEPTDAFWLYFRKHGNFNGGLNGTVTFNQTVPTLDSIRIIHKLIFSGGSTHNEWSNNSLYIKQGGQWNYVQSKIGSGVSIDGPWTDVEAVRFGIRGGFQWGYDLSYAYAQLYIYEIEAWGIALCTPDCTGKQCGDDGCGGSCGSCVGEEICRAGICVIENTCIDDNDTIMKLFYPNNSHGALWDDVSYNYDICYSEIFGEPYAGIDPHECDGTGATPNNKVIGLYNFSNSHAEIPSLDNYSTDVCYGELSCEADSSAGNGCINNGEVVVRLYQYTNSNISDANDANYPIKICCKKSSLQLDQSYWANMLREEISEADITDTVRMIWPASGFPDGTQFRFEIYEDQGAFDIEDEIRTEAMGNAIYATYHTGDSTVEATWKINQQDIANGENEDISNFFFRVYDISGEVNESGVLEVGIDNYFNEPPNATILSPNVCEFYFIGEEIPFTQNSYDIDDNITIEWDFGDGQNSSGYNTIYSYSSVGQKNIVLTVSDERGAVAYDRTSVLIVDPNVNSEKYICGHVNNPEWGENVKGFEVAFDASGDTYAIETNNCNGSKCDLDCLAGDCKNRPDVTLSGSPNWLGFKNITFSWIFDEVDLSTDQHVKYTRNGIDGAKFNISFSLPGNHWAKLNVSINPSSVTDTSFSTSFFGICREIVEDNMITWYWWDLDGNKYNPLNEEGYCVGLNGVIGGDDDCCPPGYECVSTGGPGEARCEFSTIPGICDNIFSCSDYNTSESCGNWTRCQISFFGGCGGTTSIDMVDCGEATGGGNFITEKGDSCRCEWDAIEMVCKQKTNLSSTITTSTQLKHECSTGVVHGECIEGLMGTNVESDIIWSSDLNSSQILALETSCSLESLCPSYSGTLICGKAIIKLPFFNLINLIIAGCTTIIIYFVRVNKKLRKE